MDDTYLLEKNWTRKELTYQPVLGPGQKEKEPPKAPVGGGIGQDGVCILAQPLNSICGLGQVLTLQASVYTAQKWDQ